MPHRPYPGPYPGPYPAAYPVGSDPAFTLATGPAGATAATLAALGRPILHHLDPAFGALYADTVELLRLAFETDQPRSSSRVRPWSASRRPRPR